MPDSILKKVDIVNTGFMRVSKNQIKISSGGKGTIQA